MIPVEWWWPGPGHPSFPLRKWHTWPNSFLKVLHQLLSSLTTGRMGKSRMGEEEIKEGMRLWGQAGARFELDRVCHSLPHPAPPDSLTRDEVTTQTSIPAVRIRHDGISNWPIELKGPWWNSQRERKNIDHLKEERENWFSRRQWAFTSYRGAHSLCRAHRKAW